jgi:putative hydrolase of the HAD superfamily
VSEKRAPPVEAVVWDYGGVISSPLFRGVDRFEIDMGYPAGSILELLFGESAYIGVEGRKHGGGDPIDGAPPPGASAVTHDWHRLETGELSLDEYLLGVTERAPAVLGKPIDLEAYQRFARDMPIGIHWPIIHRIRGLRADGTRIALLTNNVKEFGSAWRATFPVDELFDVVVDSSEVGMRKPDPRIYLLTCDRLRVDPSAAVFVDDNRDNCAAAYGVGMEAVHFGEDPWVAIEELDAILERRGTSPARAATSGGGA